MVRQLFDNSNLSIFMSGNASDEKNAWKSWSNNHVLPMNMAQLNSEF
jgi:hypothetical protein